MTFAFRRSSRVIAGLAGAMLLATACGSSSTTAKPVAKPKSGPAAVKSFKQETLHISAIPDQDPAKLTALYGAMATYLHTKLKVPVDYVPVTDYAASVSSFQLGDLDLVWFGGLTGVQARLQTPGAKLVAQRDIDSKFQSVFIAGSSAGLAKISSVAGLTALKNHSLTFGSESSTSGRLMPQYFLDQAGVAVADLKGQPGFSGSHDATIKAVQAGTFEVGALNSKVWDAAVAAKTVDTSKVTELFRTPTFYDYHWLARPGLDARFGVGFTAALTQAILSLDVADPAQKAILDLFSASRFVTTTTANYDKIESIGRKLGLIKG